MSFLQNNQTTSIKGTTVNHRSDASSKSDRAISIRMIIASLLRVTWTAFATTAKSRTTPVSLCAPSQNRNPQNVLVKRQLKIEEQVRVAAVVSPFMQWPPAQHNNKDAGEIPRVRRKKITCYVKQGQVCGKTRGIPLGYGRPLRQGGRQ